MSMFTDLEDRIDPGTAAKRIPLLEAKLAAVEVAEALHVVEGGGVRMGPSFYLRQLIRAKLDLAKCQARLVRTESDQSSEEQVGG